MSFLDDLKSFFKPTGEKLQVINVEKRFDLLGRTGQGSMSKVWRARDRESGKTVCLKVLDKVKTQKFEARFAGLKRPSEGKICMSLSHPHIVKTLEYGRTTEKEMYIVMELIEGAGLNFLIETNHADLKGNRINYLSQVAEALEYVHETKFLHRDLCPRNIMINQEGAVKLIDFGLSIPYRPEFCRPGNRTGTTIFLAPELIKRHATDHRVDLFALGVTAYEVFTNNVPWERDVSVQALLNLMKNPGRDPIEFRPKMDQPTRDFLIKGIECDPNRRFQTAKAFREALNALSG